MLAFLFCIFSQCRLLTDKFVLQGFLQSRLISACISFYGPFNDLIYNCKFPLGQMFSDYFYTDTGLFLAHWLRQQITLHSWSRNWAYGGCDQSTGNANFSNAAYPTTGVSGGPIISLTSNSYLYFETDHYWVSLSFNQTVLHLMEGCTWYIDRSITTIK
jgi:hypothetical protein